MKHMSASTTVTAPKKNEMDLHAARPPCFFVWLPMPYMLRLPMIPKPAFADWKNSERELCSSVLYQLPMTSTKPGPKTEGWKG